MAKKTARSKSSLARNPKGSSTVRSAEGTRFGALSKIPGAARRDAAMKTLAERSK